MNSILLVDDHPLFRKGFISTFGLSTTYYISEAGNGREAVDLALKFDFDVIFLDESMPELNGYDAARLILKAKPNSKIIALTQFDELTLILNYFKIGVRGFMSKDIDSEKISEAIRTVVAGNYFFHSRFENGIRDWLSKGLSQKLPALRFSARQLEVVILISKGKTAEQIAEQPGLTARTVEDYRYELLKKTNSSNSAELVAYIFKNGIVRN